MKSLSRKAVILTLIILANVSFAGTYSGGFGTEAEPYQIGTVSDWQELMATSDDWDANFIMIADINLQGVSLIPVGNDINFNNPLYFKGAFDGNGHVIRNATITNRPGWHISLFGLIDSNSQIRNLGVEDVNMSGERDVAGLVGLNHFGTISNCYATGKIGYATIPSGACLGGLVGLNFGTIKGSHAACDVNGTGTKIGGLVGYNFGGAIIDSYAVGAVNGDTIVGGLVGGNTFAPSDDPGPSPDDGLDYRYPGTIARCYAAGSVSGRRNVGGLAGANGEDPPIRGFPKLSITDSYSTCAVTGGSGLVGSNFGQITNCYAAGKVTGSGGGLDGSRIPPTLNCFWDIEVSGKTTSGSGIGKTTAEMMTLSTFTSAGWDFVGESTNGPNDVWFIREGKEYPRFVWENNKPVADAGPNQVAYAWIDGIAEVTLDANNSYDADGDALTYLWKWSIDGNDYETTGVDLTIELPVGQYTFELVVNDGLVNSEPNQVVITVVAPIKSAMWVTPQIINNGCFGRQSIMAILQLPAGISKKQVDSGRKLLLYPGEIKANSQFIMSYYDRRVERVIIWAYFDSNSLTDAVSKTGWVNLDVVGQLKTGQYFSSSDKVWVIKPPRKPICRWPGYGWGWGFGGCDRK
jgi:hypothetical protein